MHCERTLDLSSSVHKTVASKQITCNSCLAAEFVTHVTLGRLTAGMRDAHIGALRLAMD